MADVAPALTRRLGVGDAVVLGLGSMLGAGVFAVYGPAASAAGAGLLIALAVAAVVAYCNAVSSAQLAAVYPVSGGTYAYGRARLGEWAGFTAGWAFLVGKTASCAAMALTIGGYLLPHHRLAQHLLGVLAVVAVAALNYRGIGKTLAVTRILVTITLVVLAAFVTAVLTGGTVSAGHLSDWPSGPAGIADVLQAAGLMFFAFAGYARIATLGEEVRDPAVTIPRAIPAALGIVVVVYAVVGVAALLVAGPQPLAGANAPLAAAADAAGRSGVTPVLRVGATLAAAGSLLSLMAGIGRTGLAMARGGDLPGPLGAVHPRFRVPHRIELALATVVGVLVLTVDLRGVLGFSSFGVLVYYALANAAALTQPRAERRWPRGVNILGMVGCAVLAVALPGTSVVAGAGVIALGLLGRAVVRLRSVGVRR
ncbi:MAG: amino acid permease [Pseudonocardiales bacterium]|nr:MAG: amino acid permease [Pseudonocardiales bacterium]